LLACMKSPLNALCGSKFELIIWDTFGMPIHAVVVFRLSFSIFILISLIILGND